jgi:hypothetical protein
VNVDKATMQKCPVPDWLREALIPMHSGSGPTPL